MVDVKGVDRAPKDFDDRTTKTKGYIKRRLMDLREHNVRPDTRTGKREKWQTNYRDDAMPGNDHDLQTI